MVNKMTTAYLKRIRPDNNPTDPETIDRVANGLGSLDIAGTSSDEEDFDDGDEGADRTDDSNRTPPKKRLNYFFTDVIEAKRPDKTEESKTFVSVTGEADPDTGIIKYSVLESKTMNGDSDSEDGSVSFSVFKRITKNGVEYVRMDHELS